MKPAVGKAASKTLLADLRQLIFGARRDVARHVNSTLVLVYWQVGQRIRQDILKERRAGYGEQIVTTLSLRLSEEFGRGWSARNLAHMIRFAEVFPDANILHTLCAKLSWSHFRRIIYLDDDLRRDFYAEMSRDELAQLRKEDKGHTRPGVPRSVLPRLSRP